MTGYRKEKEAENSKKAEIWFAPRFLVKKELDSTAGHFKGILPSKWNDDASIAMFWTWGDWENLVWYYYLTSESMDNLSKVNLFENWKKSRGDSSDFIQCWADAIYGAHLPLCRYWGLFHVSFVS